MGIGVGWNEVEYVGLNEDFSNRGRRQSEQVDLMRRLWKEDSLDYHGEFHRIDKASIKPRPSKDYSQSGLAARPLPCWISLREAR